MSDPMEWDASNFDDMSWHDVHVHGFRIVENAADNGTAELILDIDYILEWLNCGTELGFVVAQASLQFHEVFGLKFTLDYAQRSAGMCAFSLAGIERVRVTYPTGYSSYKWKLAINWPAGEITFEAPDFTQRITGPSYTQPRQGLSPAQRSAA